MIVKTRYEIGKQYLLHDKWLLTAVKLKPNLFTTPYKDKLELMGFVFDDTELHNSNEKHGFTKHKDDLYYFSNDASPMVESIQTIRNNKIEQILSLI
jgi:hypothetical protein